MANRNVTHASVLAAPSSLDAARRRMAESQRWTVILIVHDGSEYGYSGKLRSLDDLGQLGNGHTRSGLPRAQLVGRPGGATAASSFGLLNQIPSTRRPHVPKAGRRDRRPALRKDRESRLVGKGLVKRLAQPRPDKRHTSMSRDRGADIFEYIEYECLNNRLFVVRATHDRAVTVDDPATLEVLGLEKPFEGLAVRTGAWLCRSGVARRWRMRAAGGAVGPHGGGA